MLEQDVSASDLQHGALALAYPNLHIFTASWPCHPPPSWPSLRLAPRTLTRPGPSSFTTPTPVTDLRLEHAHDATAKTLWPSDALPQAMKRCRKQCLLKFSSQGSRAAFLAAASAATNSDAASHSSHSECEAGAQLLSWSNNVRHKEHTALGCPEKPRIRSITWPTIFQCPPEDLAPPNSKT